MAFPFHRRPRTRRAASRGRRPARMQGTGIESLEQRRVLVGDIASTFVDDGSLARPAVVTAPRDVVLIDSALLAGIPREELANSIVVSIDGGLDAIDQISTALATFSGLDVVRVISHGSDGSLWFGDQRIDAVTLASRADDIAGWRRSLAADGDILLYGCSGGAPAGGGSAGMMIAGEATGTRVEGNEISGHVGDGLHLVDARGVTIGGVASGVGNTITDNGGAGFRVTGGCRGSTAQGNVVRGNRWANWEPPSLRRR